MKKIPKRPRAEADARRACSSVGAAHSAAPRARRRRGGTIAPETPEERVDLAFLAALMGLPDQHARSLASDVIVRHGPGAEDPRLSAAEVVRAAIRAGWEDWRTISVLADHGGVDPKTGLPRRG